MRLCCMLVYMGVASLALTAFAFPHFGSSTALAYQRHKFVTLDTHMHHLP